MPIKGRSEIYRIPRIGKVHLGIKQSNGRSEYPQATDYFVVKEDDSTSARAAEAFRKVYGDNPKELSVAFPADNPEQFFPQYLSSYKGGGGRYQLYCKGDGERATRADGQGSMVDMPCLYQDCPIYQDGKCKELGRLQFFLPEVEGIGIWQIDTTSFHSTVNLNSSIEMVRALTGGHIKMIPLTLRIVPKVVNPDGRAKTVYVLELAISNMKLLDFIEKMPRISASTAVPLIEDIRENEIPEDLYTDDNIISDADVSTPGPQDEQGDDTPSVPSTTDTDLQDVGVVLNANIKPLPGNKGEAGLVRFSPSGDSQILEAITVDQQMLTLVKKLIEGTAIQFKVERSTRFANRLEFVDLAVVS